MVDRTFRGYAETYKVEIINNRNLSDLLSVIKNSVKNLFDELLRKKRGLKYIINVKITLKNKLMTNDFNIKTLYFNSLIKTVITRGYHLNDSFEEILNLLNIWINEGSGWVIDKIEGLYIDVANYEPLLGSSYFPSPKVKIINVLCGVMLDLLILRIVTQKE